MVWKTIEAWGRNNPVSSAVLGFLMGVIPAGGIAGVGAYNLGFYAGTTTTEETWRGAFSRKVNEQVSSEIASKCGQAVSEVNTACQRQIRSLEKTIDSKDLELKAQSARIDYLNQQSEIVDIHERLIQNAESMLKSLLAAREKRDLESEKAIKSRFFSLLLDIRRMNQLFVGWGALFNGRATELTERYKAGESIPTDEIISYLDSFSADADRKRKIIQSEVNEANKIRSKKY